MTDPKPLASLTSGLLARKGGARPAMRRQLAVGGGGFVAAHDDLGWNDMGYDANPVPQGVSVAEAEPKHASGLSPMPHSGAEDGSLHRLYAVAGQDDAVPAQAVEPAVRQQQRRVAELVSDTPVAEPVAVMPAPVPAPAPKAVRAPRRRPRAEAGARGHFAFTLRLDADRHLRLRLASAATNRSAQQILVALVDDYFAGLPAIGDMAATLSRPTAAAADATDSGEY